MFYYFDKYRDLEFKLQAERLFNFVYQVYEGQWRVWFFRSILVVDIRFLRLDLQKIEKESFQRCIKEVVSLVFFIDRVFWKSSILFWRLICVQQVENERIGKVIDQGLSCRGYISFKFFTSFFLQGIFRGKRLIIIDKFFLFFFL